MRNYDLNLKRLRKHAYIDLKTITIPKGFFEDLNVPKLYDWLYSFVDDNIGTIKRGKWIKMVENDKTNNEIIDGYYCSECRQNIISKFLMNYCPFCGAKMNGDIDDE